MSSPCRLQATTLRWRASNSDAAGTHERSRSWWVAVSSGCAPACCWPATATAFACSSVIRPPPPHRRRRLAVAGSGAGSTSSTCSTASCQGSASCSTPSSPTSPRPLEADGAVRFNRLAELPDALTGGRRPGDERFDAVTGRRPMVEATLARLVDEQPGIEVLRGVAVRGLLTDGPRHRFGPARRRGDHRRRRRATRRRRHRRQRQTHATAVAALGRRRLGAAGGARRHRIRLLLPSLPCPGRLHAADSRTAVAAL